jgi:glycosyltransferase involved in cell wall biosynthesis
MKILYITNGINGSGGLERVLSIKASMLTDQYSYDVSILTLNEPNNQSFYDFSPNIKIVRVNTTRRNGLDYFLSYCRELQKEIHNIQPDIICVCDDGLKGFTLPVMIKTSAKWVYERHVSKLIDIKDTDNFFKKNISSMQWKLMEILAKNFDRFVVLTEKNLLEWERLNNIIVIPNPLSFNNDQISTLDNKKVICVGKISYQKGQDILINLWKEVNKKFPEWQLHLYGKEDLNFINTNELGNNIFFHPPEKKILQKYLESSIYVMPSRFEGFGMVLIEAMICGLPCISFDCNYGPSDIIVNNEDGFLVQNGNSDLFKKRLEQLIQDEKLRKNMGKKSRDNVERFSANHIVATWNNLFKELMK